MRAILLAAVAALALPSAVFAADAASIDASQAPATVTRTADITATEARAAVRAYLAAASENRLFLGEVTRKGDQYLVKANTVEGIPAKTFKVDAKTGEVLG